MSDQHTFGVFKQEQSIHVGDPYDPNKLFKNSDRLHGLQFSVPKPTPLMGAGGTNPPNFGEFVSIAVGDPYYDPEARRRKIANEDKSRAASTEPFKPSNPTRKGTGLGSWYGCISKPIPFGADGNARGTRARQKYQGGNLPRQIQTNPPKRGSYGVPGIIIGKDPPYAPSPYDEARKLEAAERAALRQKMRDQPFRPSSAGGSYFNMDVFKKDMPEGTRRKRPATATRRSVETPFRPSNPSRSGLTSTFSPFPPYMPDPYDNRPSQVKGKKVVKDSRGPPFIPVSNVKTRPVKSIQVV
eukprot:GFYU01005097.1.p1 GENE.GFYU01005097.1~~GFYU01005097.1.p1  ORF type:complete len:298 (-),score=56.53 GFYU01005097.1:462-1355(-)